MVMSLQVWHCVYSPWLLHQERTHQELPLFAVGWSPATCCQPCNEMKSDKSREEFLRLIAAVYHHHFVR